MQPRLPSEVVKAWQTAPETPLRPGRDDGRPDGPVPPGVFVRELSQPQGQPFRDRGRPAAAVHITLLWKNQRWRWALLPLALPFIVLPAAMLIDAHVRVLGLVLLPLGLAGALLFSWDQVGRLLNRTEVCLQSGLLTVRHRPLPWAGSLSVPIDSIRSINFIQDGIVTRVIADVGPGPERCLLRSTATIGLTYDQAAYVVDRIVPLLPASVKVVR